MFNKNLKWECLYINWVFDQVGFLYAFHKTNKQTTTTKKKQKKKKNSMGIASVESVGQTQSFLTAQKLH